MQLNPYLNFDGTTREAMEFYQKVLGGALDVQTFGDSPMEASEEDKDRVMHARLDATDSPSWPRTSRAAQPTREART